MKKVLIILSVLVVPVFWSLTGFSKEKQLQTPVERNNNPPPTDENDSTPDRTPASPPETPNQNSEEYSNHDGERMDQTPENFNQEQEYEDSPSVPGSPTQSENESEGDED